MNKYQLTATALTVFGLAMLMVDQAALAWLSFVALLFPAIGYTYEHGGLRG
jgi:hypothetical protein